MKKKIAILLILAIFGIALSMGCIEETEEKIFSMNSTNIDTDYSSYSSVKEDSHITVVKGTLIGITFNKNNQDVIVFYAGGNKKAILLIGQAEDFAWVLGEEHEVRITSHNAFGQETNDVISVDVLKGSRD